MNDIEFVMFMVGLGAGAFISVYFVYLCMKCIFDGFRYKTPERTLQIRVI